MAYLIQDEAPVEKKKQPFKRLLHFTLPKLTGKFGLSVMCGKKELFLGLAVADIEVEKIVKKRKVPTLTKSSKAKVSTWTF